MHRGCQALRKSETDSPPGAASLHSVAWLARTPGLCTALAAGLAVHPLALGLAALLVQLPGLLPSLHTLQHLWGSPTQIHPQTLQNACKSSDLVTACRYGAVMMAWQNLTCFPPISNLMRMICCLELSVTQGTSTWGSEETVSRSRDALHTGHSYDLSLARRAGCSLLVRNISKNVR